MQVIIMAKKIDCRLKRNSGKLECKPKSKVVAIALDRKTGGTVGFSKKGLSEAKKEMYQGKKRYVGFQ